MKKTLATLFTGFLLASGAYAAYPDKPVTITAVYPPGGSVDTIARVVAHKMQEKLGQPVVVENKPGASGTIGAAFVKRSAPDGYNIVCAPIGVWSINQFLQKNMPFDPAKDFDLLTVAVRAPNVLVVNPNVPVNSVQELIEYIKKKDGKVTFATGGAGTSDHLSTVLFWQSVGVSGIHVPYKGGAQAHADLIAGHADATFQNLNVMTGFVKAGKLKALAITSEKRSPLLPDVPTLTELGYKDQIVYAWQAFGAPKGLPADVKSTIHNAMMYALKDPDTVKKLTEPGFEIVASTPEEFAAFQQAEMARWKRVIEVGKITLD